MAVKIFGKTIVGGEAQRKEAAANEMSGKYPLTNDCNLMKSTIEAAKAELAQINASRPSTAGGKRIKARNSASLKTWINEMQNFLKDLTCGIVYTPEGIKITPVVATPPTAPSAPVFEPPYKPAVEPIVPIREFDQGPVRRPGVPAPIIFTREVVEEYVQPSIRCADGTYDVANGVNPPCATKGGVYMPSLPLPAPAPTLPSGQSTIVSSPLPTTAVPGLPANVVAPQTDYASLYDNAALGTQIAQSNATQAPPPTKDDTQKYLMYGGIGLVGVLVLNSLLNRD
jgi:hypothetical protein